MIGDNIVPTFDAEEKAVFFDRSAKAVFVNLSRWRDLRYVDFLFCAFRVIFNFLLYDGRAIVYLSLRRL